MQLHDQDDIDKSFSSRAAFEPGADVVIYKGFSLAFCTLSNVVVPAENLI